MLEMLEITSEFLHFRFMLVPFLSTHCWLNLLKLQFQSLIIHSQFSLCCLLVHTHVIWSITVNTCLRMLIRPLANLQHPLYKLLILFLDLLPPLITRPKSLFMYNLGLWRTGIYPFSSTFYSLLVCFHLLYLPVGV